MRTLTSACVAACSASGDLDDGSRLTYAWTQVAGPPIELAPSAAEPAVSFVPLTPGLHAFELRVTDPEGASSPPARIEVSALEPGRQPAGLSFQATAAGTSGIGRDTLSGEALRVTLPTTVSLSASFTEQAAPADRRIAFAWEQAGGPRLALLAPPADPGTSAGFVARLVAPEGVGRPRFEVFIPGLGTPAFTVAGNEGYILFRPGPAQPLRITGRRWGPETVRRELPPGFSIVHFPRGGIADLDSTDLSRDGCRAGNPYLERGGADGKAGGGLCMNPRPRSGGEVTGEDPILGSRNSGRRPAPGPAWPFSAGGLQGRGSHPSRIGSPRGVEGHCLG